MNTYIDMPDIPRTRPTTLDGLYGKSYEKYIDKIFKPGKQFWHWSNEEQNWEKITVTYVRSGVFFYKNEKTEEEKYAHVQSFKAMMLHPAVIDLKEYLEFLIIELNDEKYAKKLLNNTDWETINGRIKIVEL